MPITYNITLTDAERQALSYAAVDPEEWINNAVKDRARIAIDEIVKIAVDKFLEASETIPGSKDEIVAEAFSRGWVTTKE